jgi:hypothetical protein
MAQLCRFDEADLAATRGERKRDKTPVTIAQIATAGHAKVKIDAQRADATGQTICRMS